jgi:CBS domain-containing protein
MKALHLTATGGPGGLSVRGKRLTIIVGETDHWRHQPLYMAILERLKAAGCAGATATRGLAGFGQHSQIKTANILRLSLDLPVMVTVVDTAERIEQALPEISGMMAGGVITVDDAELRFSSAAFKGGLPDVRVGDLMSSDVEAVTPETPIAEVVERLVARDYTALPVVDGDRRVVGMIGDSDLLTSGLTRLSVSLHKAIGPELIGDFLSRLKKEGVIVREAMTSPAVTVRPDTPLKAAAHLMHERGLKRLPVVDANGRLCGVLGRLDILQSIAAGHARRVAPHAPLPQEHRTVAEIMEPSLPTVLETVAWPDVVEKLLSSDAKRVLVVDFSGRPVGIITDTDIIARIDPEERPGILTLLRSRWSTEARRKVRRTSGQRASDIMTSPVVTVRDSAPVMQALALTVERHVKRLPVVDAEGHVVGVVSRPALLAASLDLAPGEPQA